MGGSAAAPYAVAAGEDAEPMTKDTTLVRRIVVEGFVQGVGYRDFTRRAALRLNVSGWVRNRADGAVEALVHGSPASAEAPTAGLRRGPAAPAGPRLTPARPAEARGADSRT